MIALDTVWIFTSKSCFLQIVQTTRVQYSEVSGTLLPISAIGRLIGEDEGLKNGVYFQLFNAIYLAATDIFTSKSSFSKNTDYACVLASEVLEPFLPNSAIL